MNKAERKQILIEMRELCRKPVDENNYLDVLNKVSQGVKDADFRDTRYSSNLEKFADKLQGGIFENIDKNMNKFTFEECKTLFTRILRGEHWNAGSFPYNINNKRFFKILERAIEVMP